MSLRMENPIEYRTYRSMIQRCENPNVNGYHRYGGRGIRVCARWRNSFQAFVGDMGARPLGMSIDRIDSDRGYSCGKCADCAARGEPRNCRWATAKQQAENPTSTKRGRRPRAAGVVSSPFTFRASVDERTAWHASADESEMTLSDWAREKLNKAAK